MRIKALLGKPPRFLLTWGIPVCIILSYSFLALQPDLRGSIPELIGTTAFVTIMLAVALYAAGEKGVTWSPLVLIGVALAVRLLFLFRPPELSDDIYRYLWDGLQTLSGKNPYTLSPSSAQAFDQSSLDLLKLVNHPDLVTIYPPGAQVIFAMGAFLTKKLLGIKLLLTVLDVGTCCMMIKLLTLLKIPTWRVVLYAWNPLAVIEVAGSGHIDIAGIFFLFVSLLLLVSHAESHSSLKRACETKRSSLRREVAVFSAGIAFTFATLVKLLPLIFLPIVLFFVRSRDTILFLTGIFIAGIALTVPFLPDLTHMFITLNTYLQNWEFSGILFRSFRVMTASGNTARLIVATAFALSVLFLYIQFWFKKNRSPFQALYYVTIVFLFLTPTLHPWYVLYLACLLPFVPGPGGLALTWSIFLSYRVIIQYFLLGQWVEDTYTAVLVWSAPCATYLLTFIATKIKNLNPDK